MKPDPQIRDGNQKQTAPRARNDSAVSELVGTVMLISVMVLAASIFTVAIIPILSSDINIPNVDIMAFNDTDRAYIRHADGDVLHKDTFRILIDGVNNGTLSLGNATSQGWAQSDDDKFWEPGETLFYDFPGSTVPSTITIIYEDGEGAYVLYSVTVDRSGIPPPGVTYPPDST